MEEILKRNNEILKRLIKKYEIEYTVEELINLESVFIFVEYYKDENRAKSGQLYRAILYANAKHTVKNGNIVKFDKVKKISLYTFAQKQIKKLFKKEVDKIVLDLTLISKLVNQLKLIKKFNKEEAEIREMLYSSNFK